MELIAGDVQALHRGIADFDALLIAARIERAFDLEPGVGGGCADQLDHGETIRERSAAPLRRAWRIVVDVDRKPRSAASFCRSIFQSRTRAPFEPPQSAVIVSSRACG